MSGSSEATFTVEQALELADEWEQSGQLPAPLIVDLARAVRQLLALEARGSHAMSMIDAKMAAVDNDRDIRRQTFVYAREMLQYVFEGANLGGGAVELERLRGIERRAREIAAGPAGDEDSACAAQILGEDAS